MYVRATNRGFYKWMRQIGDVFEIPPELFASEWMTEHVTEDEPAPEPTAQAQPEPEAQEDQP